MYHDGYYCLFWLMKLPYTLMINPSILIHSISPSHPYFIAIYKNIEITIDMTSPFAKGPKVGFFKVLITLSCIISALSPTPVNNPINQPYGPILYHTGTRYMILLYPNKPKLEMVSKNMT